MTNYDFGAVVLVPFPFTDQSGKKKRPAVVVSSDTYNASRLDLILMAITSQIRPAPVFGEVVAAEWQKAGLLKSSIVKPIMTTIEKRLIIRQLGCFEPSDLIALQRTLSVIIG